MAKKLLIITYYWPPSGGPGVQRWLKFVKYLRNEGIEPEILTVENPTYPILDETLAKEIPTGIKVYGAPALEPYALYAKLLGKKKEDVSKLTIRLDNRGVSKEGIGTWIRANFFIPDARMGWIYPVYRKALELHKQNQYDGFITTGPPHSTHVAGRLIQKNSGLYWLADMRDPWTMLHYNQLIPRTWLAKKVDAFLEKMVYTHANDVVVVTPGMRRDFESIYPNRYHVVPNGYDEDDLPATEPKKDGTFVFRHLGSLPESTMPYGFFEALSKLPESLDWRMEFIGNVHPEAYVQVEKFGLTQKVLFLPYIPHHEAVRKMMEADVLCLYLAKTPGNKSIYSGKLFEYAAVKKPVIFIGATDGDAPEFLEKTGLGFCREHEDVEGIRSLFEGFILGKQPLPVPNQAQETFIKQFSRRNLTAKLAEIIRNGLSLNA